MKMLLIDCIDEFGHKQSYLDSINALGCPYYVLNVQIVDAPIKKISFVEKGKNDGKDSK